MQNQAHVKSPESSHPLQWRHNGHNNISNRQPHPCYSTVYSGTDQRKHQSSASLAFVQGIHRRPVNSPHKWLVTWQLFLFDDVIMHITPSTPMLLAAGFQFLLLKNHKVASNATHRKIILSCSEKIDRLCFSLGLPCCIILRNMHSMDTLFSHSCNTTRGLPPNMLLCLLGFTHAQF